MGARSDAQGGAEEARARAGRWPGGAATPCLSETLVRSEAPRCEEQVCLRPRARALPCAPSPSPARWASRRSCAARPWLALGAARARAQSLFGAARLLLGHPPSGAFPAFAPRALPLMCLIGALRFGAPPPHRSPTAPAVSRSAFSLPSRPTCLCIRPSPPAPRTAPRADARSLPPPCPLGAFCP